MGEDREAAELPGDAALIAGVTGYAGSIGFDSTKPDGTMRKLLDVGLLSRLGWTARIELEDGVRQTYEWFLSNAASIRQ